jgi:hypothetical protein
MNAWMADFNFGRLPKRFSSFAGLCRAAAVLLSH